MQILSEDNPVFQFYTSIDGDNNYYFYNGICVVTNHSQKLFDMLILSHGYDKNDYHSIISLSKENLTNINNYKKIDFDIYGDGCLSEILNRFTFIKTLGWDLLFHVSANDFQKKHLKEYHLVHNLLNQHIISFRKIILKDIKLIYPNLMNMAHLFNVSCFNSVMDMEKLAKLVF